MVDQAIFQTLLYFFLPCVIRELKFRLFFFFFHPTKEKNAVKKVQLEVFSRLISNSLLDAAEDEPISVCIMLVEL